MLIAAAAAAATISTGMEAQLVPTAVSALRAATAQAHMIHCSTWVRLARHALLVTPPSLKVQQVQLTAQVRASVVSVTFAVLVLACPALPVTPPSLSATDCAGKGMSCCLSWLVHCNSCIKAFVECAADCAVEHLSCRCVAESQAS
jgi:hypothetical protein